MGEQRNMPQTKEQRKKFPRKKKFPGKKKFNEMETSSLWDTELKTMVIKIFQELRGRMNKLGENFKKETVNINKDIKIIKMEMNSTISEKSNTLEGIKSRLDEVEN